MYFYLDIGRLACQTDTVAYTGHSYTQELVLEAGLLQFLSEAYMGFLE
jgi:hypothetical protein